MDAQNKIMTQAEFTEMMTKLWETCKAEGATFDETIHLARMTTDQMVTDGWRIVEG